MALPKHMNDAVARLEEATSRIEQAGKAPLSLENVQEWLNALTDYAFSLNELQTYANESIHEKLHFLAGHTGLKQFPPQVGKQ